MARGAYFLGIAYITPTWTDTYLQSITVTKLFVCTEKFSVAFVFYAGWCGTRVKLCVGSRLSVRVCLCRRDALFVWFCTFLVWKWNKPWQIFIEIFVFYEKALWKLFAFDCFFAVTTIMMIWKNLLSICFMIFIQGVSKRCEKNATTNFWD